MVINANQRHLGLSHVVCMFTTGSAGSFYCLKTNIRQDFRNSNLILGVSACTETCRSLCVVLQLDLPTTFTSYWTHTLTVWPPSQSFLPATLVVCLQECLCSRSTPLLPCLYLFLILFYHFLSSSHLSSYTLRVDQSALLYSLAPPRWLSLCFSSFRYSSFLLQPPTTLSVFLSPRALVFSSVHSAPAIFVLFLSSIPIIFLE